MINIISTLGAIGLSKTMAMIPKTPDKVSKAALYVLTVQYALELEETGLIVFCRNLGHLQTDLGGDGGELPIAVGTKSMLDVDQIQPERTMVLFAISL